MVIVGYARQRLIMPNETSLDDDKFAPFRGEKICQSPSGFWRSYHLFDREGTCSLCGAKEESC